MTMSSINVLIDANALQRRIMSLMDDYIVQFFRSSIHDMQSNFITNTFIDTRYNSSHDIARIHANHKIVVVYVNPQSRKFAEDFYSYLEQRQFVDTRTIKSNDFTSQILHILDCHRDNIQGKDVIVLHNIVEHENSISESEESIRLSSPNSICSISLLCPHNIECNADFIGFTIPTDRIVGYGLSWKGHFQQLYHISTVS